MSKTYVIWQHSKFIDEINRQTTTIASIADKTQKTLAHLKKLQRFEDIGKIKVKVTGSLNPICIQIIDPIIEPEVAKNPLVELLDK